MMTYAYLRTILLYTILIGFIAAWWLWAFSRTPELSNHFPLTTNDLANDFSSFTRNDLLQALRGDFSLMGTLLSQWDREAQKWQMEGISGIERLSEEKFAHAQLLAHLIQSEKQDALNEQLRAKFLCDDSGQWLDLNKPFSRFLPQTYLAASFLLALVDPEQIVALPRGLRDHPQLYPKELLEHIPSNDRYQSETLHLAHPDLAFIAHYSHPSTVQTLREQGIRLWTINNIDAIADIQKALIKVGHLCNRPLKAHLLNLFMEGALLAIDNHFLLLAEKTKGFPSQKLLYLNYQNQYLLPTTKSLTGQLLKRLNTHYPNLDCLILESQTEWKVPFDYEKIVQFHPDYLILSSGHPEHLKKAVEHHQFFSPLPHCRLAYIDEAIQESPTQYMILAYFDLFQTVAAMQ